MRFQIRARGRVDIVLGKGEVGAVIGYRVVVIVEVCIILKWYVVGSLYSTDGSIAKSTPLTIHFISNSNFGCAC